MKRWSKPELTVLVRSRPEEAVLTGCKLTADVGPSTYFADCMRTIDPPEKCLGRCHEAATT